MMWFLFLRLFLVSSCYFALQVSAGSFELQQNNATIFDGIKGEQGDLLLDPHQALHLWKASEDSAQNVEQNGFAYRRMNGDFILTVQLKSPSRALSGADFGIQVDAQDATFSMKTKIDSLGGLYVELESDKKTALVKLNTVKSPDVFQLEQNGNELIFSAANFGKPLKRIARYPLPKPQFLDVGIYRQFSATERTSLELHNLRWVIPAWKNFVAYRDFIGSRLEILDVQTGKRNVIYETGAGIEAPNWTADGENIFYNSSGRVYRLHYPTKKIFMVNTGFAVKIDNDHVVTYKNKTMGITHLETTGEYSWNIFKISLDGGDPQQLTFKPPAYLHSWSPDGRYILYTSFRNEQFDIFRGATDGSGEELQLTNDASMDDASEYTPDGKGIYFNSNRNGTMKIWRMDADGQNPKQITHDSFNDWFPHVSPDSKHLIFLSYSPELESTKHPHYEQVTLRIMSPSGGEPKVIAYLYGGQGTINVPSWSPDSRFVAFVSNSQLGTEKR